MADTGYLSIYGLQEVRETLGRAIAAGRLPQSLLFQGPRGVGKQRLAIWTAAALNCSGGSGSPCGGCHSCRLAATLEHPDIHWFFPLPRPKRASGPQKMAEKLEDLRAEELQARRENVAYTDESEGATGIYVGAVHTMRRLAQSSAAMGPTKTLIVGRAEALIPQTGSHEAANALLKLLEEPPADTTLILTSDVPGALLPTIRSRVQLVHVPRQPDEIVSEYLVKEAGATEEEARALLPLSGGSIGRALILQNQDGSGIRQNAIELVKAMLDGDQATRLAAAHIYNAYGARGSFSQVVTEVTALLRDLLASACGAAEAVVDRDAVEQLERSGRPSVDRLTAALAGANAMRSLADRNVNPQLIVANWLAEEAG